MREKESEREQRRDGAKAKRIGGEKEQGRQKLVARGLETAGQDSLMITFDTQTTRFPTQEQDDGIRMQMSKTIVFGCE